MSTKIYEFTINATQSNFIINEDSGAKLRSIAKTSDRIEFGKKIVRYDTFNDFLNWLKEVGAFEGKEMWGQLGASTNDMVNLHVVSGHGDLFVNGEASSYEEDNQKWEFDPEKWVQPKSARVANWMAHFDISQFYFAFQNAPLPMVREELWMVSLPENVLPHSHSLGLPRFIPHETIGESDHSDTIITPSELYEMLDEVGNLWEFNDITDPLDILARVALQKRLFKRASDLDALGMWSQFQQFYTVPGFMYPERPEDDNV